MKGNFANSGCVAVVLVFAGLTSELTGYAQGYTLAQALNATNLVWTADSTDNTAWSVETAMTHDGVAAVECVPHVAASGAKLHTTVIGPGILPFWFCFGNGPALGTWLEIVLQKQDAAAQHVLFGGGNEWTSGGMTIGEGTYDVQWGCVVKSTAEPVFLDEIEFTPSVTTKGLGIVDGQAD